jgi:hypothetical protein
MSEHSTAEFTSLEDLFLSREFGRPRAGGTNLDPESDPERALFGGSSVRAPLVPMVPLAGVPAGAWSTSGTGSGVVHGTTTHIRRNRTFAAMSGAAAALLVAVGLAGSLGHSNKTNGIVGKSALQSGGKAIKTGTGNGNGKGNTPTPGTTNPAVTSTGTDLGNSTRNGAGGKATLVNYTTPTPIQVVNCCAPTPTTPSGSQPTTTPTPPTAAKTGLLPLVGSVVSTVGTTVTGVSSDVNTTVPALKPVGDLVAPVGGTVVDLGDVLSGLSA